MATTAPDAKTLEARYNEAVRLADRGEGRAAEKILREILQHAPNSAAVHAQLGRLARRRRDYDTALKHLREAVRLAPESPKLYGNLVIAAEEAGDYEEVLRLIDARIKEYPQDIVLKVRKATAYQQLGQFDKAGRLLRRLIEKAPKNAQLYRLLAQGEKLKLSDPVVRKMMKLAADPELDGERKIALGYALAKVMADNKQYDKVFPYLHLANGQERKEYPYDFSETKKTTTALLAAQEGLEFPPRPESPDFVPIFIIGTPRSGTTLLERILSRHSKIGAGGETGFPYRGALHVFEDQKTKKFRPASEIPPEMFDGYARAIERHMRAIAPGAWAVTDKSMQTHRIMGLIRHAIPQARMIVLKRDPRDVAVSMYRNQFVPGSHRYANDLGDIARYIKNFHDTIEHWRERMPGEFIEVNYEDIVSDPETETRRLLDFIGVEWEDACLAPHEGGGLVKTLSIAQVRQPIYKSSARGWERYAKDLKPFDEVWEKLHEAG